MLDEPVIKYCELPVAKSKDGECAECSCYPNTAAVMLTDQGDMMVIQCSFCDALMRPYQG